MRRKGPTKQQVVFREKAIAMIIIVTASVGVILPLLYMIGGSFSSKQVINTVPQSILPVEGRQVTIDDPELAGKKFKVYNVVIDGEKKQLAYIDQKVDKNWVYVDPDEPSKRYEAPPALPDDRVKAVVFNTVNYPEAWKKSPFPLYVRNTLFIVLMSTLGTVLSTTFVAYGFSRFYFKAKNVIFLILLSTMMLPAQVSLIPSFIVFQKLGWYNTYLPLIVPAFFAVSAWNVFLMRQFFMGLPLELDDAARIDGCGPLGILWNVILPQAVPVILTITLFTMIFWWNEYFYSLIYLQDSKLFTVALGIQQFDALYFNNNSLKAAATVMMMMPPIMIFFFAQRYFIQGTVISGIKG